MKIKPSVLSPNAWPTVRGVYLTLDTKHGPILQKWPKKRGKAKSGGDYYKQKEFGLVAKMVSTPHPIDYGTAVEMAKNTSFIPRDILMMCAYGTYYTIVGPDGVEWTRYRDVTVNAQATLDQVTDIPGSMMFRNELGWYGVPPGSIGWLLSYNDYMPQWVPPSALVATDRELWLTAQPTTVSATLFASKGGVFELMTNLVCSGGTARIAEVSGQSYIAKLFDYAGVTLGTERAASAPWTASATGNITRLFDFITPYNCNVNQGYCILITRTSATNTTSCGLWNGVSITYAVPCLLPARSISLAQNNPVSGQVLTFGGNNTFFAVSPRFK